LHLDAERRAEALLDKLKSGELNPLTDVPERTVLEFAVDESGRKDPLRRHASLSPAELHGRRAQYPGAIGQVSPLEEDRDRFVFSVVLSESPRAFRVARYAVPKVSWDTWWKKAGPLLRFESVAAVASNRAPVPVPSQAVASIVPPGYGCTDLGLAGENNVRMTCGGLIDSDTERVDIVLGGPASGSTTLRGLEFSVPYNHVLEFLPDASYTSPLFGPNAEISVTQPSGVPDFLNISIREPDTIVDPVSVDAGQHTVLSLKFRRRAWQSFGPVYLTFQGALAVSASTPISFSNTVSLYYETCPPEDSWRTMSADGAPSPRLLHTAVWTGNVMVIWGGWDGSFELATGGRYDPVTDTWTPTATAGSPSPRDSHSAVWTGSAMVVWGGWDGGGEVDTGGRYDPATDAWAPTATLAAPSEREAHTAVWTGSAMVVWGGYKSGTSVVFPGAGGRYNPTTDSWSPTSTVAAPTPRYSHTAVWTGSQMVVWGGDFYDGVDHFQNTGGRYNPVTDVWTPTSTTASPSARGAHTAVWTGTRMVIWGGVFFDGANHFLNTGGRYDPATDSWMPTSTPSAPQRRDFHTATWTGKRMVVWGGFTQGDFDTVLDTGGRYDPTTDTWLPTSRSLGLPSPRAGHSGVSIGDLMLIWGGGNFEFALGSGARYALSASDDDGDGFRECAGDCDDANPALHPGADDICNGIDDDCDGAIDHLADRFCVDDGNPCTTEECHGTPECDHVDNDSLCEDGDACTWNDRCGNGACVGGTPMNCFDFNLCTDDSCDSDTGCVHTDISASCTDGNVCTADACNPASGCSTIHKPINIDTESFSVDRVDGRDLVILANAWNSCFPDPRYNAAVDYLGPDSLPPQPCIDEVDFHLFMNAFGQGCP